MLACKPKGPSNLHTLDIKAYPEAVANAQQLLSAIEEHQVDEDLQDYAFSLITPHGKKIFQRVREYINTQQLTTFRQLAQPLECSRNVAHVISEKSLGSNSDALRAPQSIAGLQNHLCSTLKSSCLEYAGSSNQSDFLEFLKKHFSTGIPTGTVILGLHKTKRGGFSGHSAIVGDKDHHGHLMLYHNNWYRPGSLNAGLGEILRRHYMVPVEQFYSQKRPNSWMATPWVKLIYDGEGNISGYERTPLKEIDDLDVNNDHYTFSFIIHHQIAEEVNQGKILKFRKSITGIDNVHYSNYSSENPPRHEDDDKTVCVTTESYRTLTDHHTELSNHPFAHAESTWKSRRPDASASNPWDRPLEFYPLGEENGKIRAQVFVKYSGGSHNGFWGDSTPLLIPKEKTICKEVWQWKQCYACRKTQCASSIRDCFS